MIIRRADAIPCPPALREWGTPRRRYALLFAMGAVAGSAALAAAEPLVTIVGGENAADNNYVWTITNHHDSPIVHVEIPQYRGSWRMAPDGWTGEVTHRHGVGGRSGKFIATADDETRGIARGQSAEFKLGIISAKTPSGQGQVLIRFADGKEVQVLANVPVKESASDRNISLIGLGLIFGVYVLVRAIKKRRRSPTEPR